MTTCACGQYLLKETYGSKQIPRFISRRPIVDWESHTLQACDYFDREDVPLP